MLRSSEDLFVLRTEKKKAGRTLPSANSIRLKSYLIERRKLSKLTSHKADFWCLSTGIRCAPWSFLSLERFSPTVAVMVGAVPDG